VNLDPGRGLGLGVLLRIVNSDSPTRTWLSTDLI